ncbi:MAG: hypothetical protein RHS_3537 [Robinsoniella sp. RHS]|nr:MAG: hypothetical protein RHS_3537 [Robinsoniella sp. RHS]
MKLFSGSCRQQYAEATESDVASGKLGGALYGIKCESGYGPGIKTACEEKAF